MRVTVFKLIFKLKSVLKIIHLIFAVFKYKHIVNMPCLIITSCVTPSAPFTKLSDSKLREEYHIDALRKWITSSTIQDIIICDNSGYAFPEELKTFAIAFDKKLEILSFNGDNSMIESKGKGYGEGEIMKYVIKHSKLLPLHTNFFKITGKLFVENFNTIAKNIKADYYFDVSKKIIDTRFYYCSLKLYSALLLNAYKDVDDYNGYYLENTFYDRLSTLKPTTFYPTSIITGFSGTQAINSVNDKGSLKRMLKDLLAYFGILNVLRKNLAPAPQHSKLK